MADRPKRRPIGALIREAMKLRGMKQGQVADKLGASRSAVNSWINDRAYPQPWLMGPLEAHFGVRLENLPAIVADNFDLPEVVSMWVAPGLSEDERVGSIVKWLRRNHPERLPAAGGGPAG